MLKNATGAKQGICDQAVGFFSSKASLWNRAARERLKEVFTFICHIFFIAWHDSWTLWIFRFQYCTRRLCSFLDHLYIYSTISLHMAYYLWGTNDKTTAAYPSDDRSVCGIQHVESGHSRLYLQWHGMVMMITVRGMFICSSRNIDYIILRYCAIIIS